MPRSTLLLIDEDVIFGQALQVWLESIAQVVSIANADTALSVLATAAIDLVLIDLRQGLPLVEQIRAQYPSLPILVLSDRYEPILLAAARQIGATGYCTKDQNADVLLSAIRTVAAGQPFWQRSIPAQAPFARLRRDWRQLGLRRINTTLAEINAQLQQNLSPLDRAILEGRARELRVSRWIVDRISGAPDQPIEPAIDPLLDRSTPPALPTASVEAITVVEPQSAQMDVNVLRSLLWDRIVAKLQTNLQNQTNITLEIDILRIDKKRELFFLILRRIEDVIAELRYSQVSIEQLFENRSLILQDLWQAIVTDFFGKYAQIQVGRQLVSIVEVLLQERETVLSAILDSIPETPELFAHLLYQTPLVINGQPQPTGNPEALLQAELLLGNLIIQLANSIIQPLLNRFGNVAIVQQAFYDIRLMSVREVERFRNNLSWKYRLTQLVIEPKAIFESRHLLLYFSDRGIEQTAIYAPRNQELDRLGGVPLVVTIALEARDAIAPRLRSTLSVLGSGVVYVLTEVVGRGIGLIGRGILKGLGSAWQDVRTGRDRRL
ncbi:DUF3685 domain-containing protein [Microcoleus sp. FACHB-1515]|uniref:DUF3685 domain-containing protein n=1 Tax=Cyanophyceae TaxID=3028117 RepID=UPI00168928E9|nr:DUF3685 domain-containing protein [Microcoleus sp. FACHB-1515]MBD2089935.1 DUF3685 domain-containing protein [Microcoleus sp. FACHB-1515]